MIEIPPCPYVGGFPQDSSRDFLERIFRQRLIETFAVGLVLFRGSGRWPATTQAEWQALLEASGDLTPVKIKELCRLYYEPRLFALLVACQEHQLSLLEEYWARLDKKPVALRLVFAIQLAGIDPDTDDLKRLARWMGVRPFTPTSADCLEWDEKDRHQEAFATVLEFLKAPASDSTALEAGPHPSFPLPLAASEAELWEKQISGVWPQIVRLITDRLAPALDARDLKIGVKRDLIDNFKHERRNPLSFPDKVQVIDEPEATEEGTENRPEAYTPIAPDELLGTEDRITLAHLIEKAQVPVQVENAILDYYTTGLTWEEVAKRHKTTRQTIHNYLSKLSKLAKLSPLTDPS